MTTTSVTERQAPPPEVVAEGFNEERAQTYAAATRMAPDARRNEALQVGYALDRLVAAPLQRVVELGTGQGFGTARILERLAPDGVVHGVDASPFMLGHAKEDKRLKRHAGALDQLQLQADSADLAFSIAAFHHIPNKWITLEEVRRVLKPGAAFLIVDVAHDTPAQRTFDYIVRPYCTSGHDADFLDKAWASVLARRAGFTLEAVRVEDTDWHFASEPQMLEYVRDLFCLHLPLPEIRVLLDRWLAPYQAEGGRWVLPWSLGFYTLRKP
ncbi:class I SAM-dependent methyltransferase [Ramlibacter sp.]|uniref:class I SAM-dependent methyltransferase n=1 Tax=Ramlibacter sp. TaxID=1917967 RepID=UPI0017B81921|nr:class I SAM-dependent methyltransferase [Ramlibacter sp.]MBA2675452.1 class I SAM-dependent methyltransferase [Ramlibacter sp.]